MNREWRQGEYTISDDRSRIDDDRVTAMIGATYWAKDIPRETMVRALDNSLVFGIYHDEDGQVGLARVITDRATYAYLCDVLIFDGYRGRGLGVWLVETIAAHPDLQGLRRWSLATRDAHGLYEKIGFTPVAFPNSYMERSFPNLYRRKEPVEPKESSGPT